MAEYRTLGSLVSEAPSRDETTAGRLLGSLVDKALWDEGKCSDRSTGVLCATHQFCPFAQNARWLRDGSLRKRFLDTLRAAEVAAARRFTYRELLGQLSLAVIGEPEEAWLVGGHPCDWAAGLKQAADGGSSTAVGEAVAHRIYTNLFQASAEDKRRVQTTPLEGDTLYGCLRERMQRKTDQTAPSAFERAFHDIDPSRDVDAWGGLRVRALDVVESLDVKPPTEQFSIWTELPPASLGRIESLFDSVLQQEIKAELSSGSGAASRRVRALRRWRSMLALRQVGVSLGLVGMRLAIQAWLSEQENALSGRQRTELGDGVQNLLAQPVPGGKVVLAPLRPRTHCISGSAGKDLLLVSVAGLDLGLSIVAQGDTLVAEVQLGRASTGAASLAVSAFVVDLAIAREALLHVQSDSRSFTEIGYAAFARIERARASLISRSRMRSHSLLFTGSAEVMGRLSVNPGGTAPFRVRGV